MIAFVLLWVCLLGFVACLTYLTSVALRATASSARTYWED